MWDRVWLHYDFKIVLFIRQLDKMSDNILLIGRGYCGCILPLKCELFIIS